MGTSKQLLLLGNKTVLRHCVDTLASIDLQDLVVVTGAEHGACAEALLGAKSRLVRNDAPDAQMADSVRIGLAAIDETCSGVLVCLADHPLVSTDTYRAVLDAHCKEPEKIIIPAFDGRRGHPGLFPYSVISDIFFAATLRDLVREDDGRVLTIDVPDEGIVLDMDTRDDYQRILERYSLRPDTGQSRV
jgi:molybdenum cofactor cytidylyltransferase